MKLKHFLLSIAVIGYFAIFFTSCSQGDEMGLGTTVPGKDPDSMIQSTKDSSTTEVSDTIICSTSHDFINN